jgi:glycosidase
MMMTACSRQQPEKTQPSANEPDVAKPARKEVPRPAVANLDDKVLYEIFVRNHGPNGTLSEVQEDLDRIEELGVDILWLMPIYPVGQEKRKGSVGSPYSVTDYTAVHPDLGTADDLKALVDAAHERGMYVILDYVPNHTAWDHPFTTNHPDWYAKDGEGNIRAPNAAWDDVAQLDYMNMDLRKEVESILTYWPQEFNIDGYRMDVAGMIPGPFWREVIPTVEKQTGKLIWLAEAVGPLYHRLGFDLSYDEPLRNHLWSVTQGQQPAYDIMRYLDEAEAEYVEGALLMRYTENHDIARTAHAFPGAAGRAAAAAVFTVRGVPMIYAGQEAGLTDTPDLFEDDRVDWAAGDSDMFAFYQRLIDMRKTHPALTRGSRTELISNHPDTVLAFLREHEDDRILVVINLADRVYDDFRLVGIEEVPDGPLTDALNGDVLNVTRIDEMSLSFPIGPYAIHILDASAP